MKKNILFVLMFLIMPVSVYANTITLDCPNEINFESEFVCTINGNSTKEITSLSANVKVGKDSSFMSFIPDENWNGDGANGRIDLYTADGFNGNFKIGTLKLKNNNSVNSIVTVEMVVFYGSDDSENSVNSVSKTIKVKQTDNKSDETTDNKTNNTNGNNNVGSNNSSNNVSNNTTNNNSNNNTSNNVSDNNNENNDEIDNDSEENIVSSNYLTDLLIDGYSIDFNKEIFEYNLEIRNDENSLNMAPLLEDNSSSYEIIGNENLKDGSLITISVSSEDGGVREYKINISKKSNSGKNEKKDYKFIFVIIIVLLIVINIGRIVMNRRNNNEEQE